jgi:hypothetical protein
MNAIAFTFQGMGLFLKPWAVFPALNTWTEHDGRKQGIASCWNRHTFCSFAKGCRWVNRDYFSVLVSGHYAELPADYGAIRHPSIKSSAPKCFALTLDFHLVLTALFGPRAPVL